MSDPRYYLYISDAKLEMLFSQVPNATQHKVAAKFGFDIGVFKGSLATERQTYDSRVARLRAVEDYLLETVEVGRPGDIKPWISGTIDARFVDISEGAVLLVAKLSQDYFALGGSAKHLLSGGPTPESVGVPFSFLYGITSHLTRLVERSPEQLLEMPEKTLEHYLAPGVEQEFDAWISTIQWAWDHSKQPLQTVGFLAKRLVTKTLFHGEYRVTLGTPLYISLED